MIKNIINKFLNFVLINPKKFYTFLVKILYLGSFSSAILFSIHILEFLKWALYISSVDLSYISDRAVALIAADIIAAMIFMPITLGLFFWLTKTAVYLNEKNKENDLRYSFDLFEWINSTESVLIFDKKSNKKLKIITNSSIEKKLFINKNPIRYSLLKVAKDNFNKDFDLFIKLNNNQDLRIKINLIFNINYDTLGYNFINLSYNDFFKNDLQDMSLLINDCNDVYSDEFQASLLSLISKKLSLIGIKIESSLIKEIVLEGCVIKEDCNDSRYEANTNKPIYMLIKKQPASFCDER